MSRLLLALTIMLAMFSACTQEQKQSSSATGVKVQSPNTVAPTYKGSITTYDQTALSKLTPFQFLDSLKTHTAESFVRIVPTKDWIKADDIPKLFSMVHDRTACAGVVSSEINNIPPRNIHSTVGVEAMMLIEGYRAKKYPAYPTSVEFSKAMQMDKDKKLVLYPQEDLIQRQHEWIETQF